VSKSVARSLKHGLLGIQGDAHLCRVLRRCEREEGMSPAPHTSEELGAVKLHRREVRAS
jgi:hypothetical protein